MPRGLKKSSLIYLIIISLGLSSSARYGWSDRPGEVCHSTQIMPLLTFDKVLKIISTILNILSAALAAFGSSWNVPAPTDDGEGHA